MINLLPSGQKDELLKEEIFKVTLILGIIIIAFLICLSLILLAIKVHIGVYIDSQKIFAVLEEKEFSEILPLQGKLNSLNEELSKLNSFYQDQFNVSGLLEQISRIIPEGIYLTSFFYDKKGSQLTLSGFAPTVENLVALKNGLEKQVNFSQIYFPSELWLKSANVEFNITLKVAEK